MALREKEREERQAAAQHQQRLVTAEKMEKQVGEGGVYVYCMYSCICALAEVSAVSFLPHFTIPPLTPTPFIPQRLRLAAAAARDASLRVQKREDYAAKIADATQRTEEKAREAEVAAKKVGGGYTLFIFARTRESTCVLVGVIQHHGHDISQQIYFTHFSSF